jgi:hypothetical protein
MNCLICVLTYEVMMFYDVNDECWCDIMMMMSC